MSLVIVVGGQFGSEGKGAVCGRLCRERKFDWAVRVGGPNAGHCVMREGQKFALRQLPVAAVVSPDTWLVIAAGSEVDPEVLEREIELVEAAGVPVRNRLFVDCEATVLTEMHAEAEAKRFGEGQSTKKGIGAARADRALRKALRVEGLRDLWDWRVVGTQGMLRQALERGETVMLEGTQGYGLGSHAGWYPDCTSGDCRAVDFVAAAGLPYGRLCEVWVVLRTYPIRIAGDSGELRREISWQDVGVEPEYTTVTKKMRRVGRWDWELATAAVEANRGSMTHLAITFADYWWPEIRGEDGRTARLPPVAREKVQEIQRRLQAPVHMLGTGPDTQVLLGWRWR